MMRLFGASGLLAIAAAAGCGTGSADSPAESADDGGYEERLSATAEEFAYHEQLRQNLAKDRWEKLGISLRVPKPFHLVKTAAKTNPSTRELLGVSLPGVLDIWQAVLPGREAGDQQTAYLFVISNHHLLKGDGKPAAAFHQSLVKEVLPNLPGRKRLPIEYEWKTDNGSGHGLPMTTASFPATFKQTDEPADFTFFLMHYGENKRRDEVKVAMIYVIPQAAKFTGSRPEADPLRLSAETVLITPFAKVEK